MTCQDPIPLQDSVSRESHAAPSPSPLALSESLRQPNNGSLHVPAQETVCEAGSSRRSDDSEDFWISWLTDPDGNRIELVPWPAGHPDRLTRADVSG